MSGDGEKSMETRPNLQGVQCFVSRKARQQKLNQGRREEARAPAKIYSKQETRRTLDLVYYKLTSVRNFLEGCTFF